jgi:hypothetical protein
VATLFADLSSLATPGSRPHDDDLWSLTDVADLIAATDYAEAAAREFDRAFAHDSTDLRRSWLDAIADAYHIDKTAIASQARHLQCVTEEANDTEPASDDWFVIAAKPLAKPSLPSNPHAALTTEQQQTLLSCLDADSNWIAWAATYILLHLDNPPWDSNELFEKNMTHRPRWRAGLVLMVAIITAGHNRELLLRRAAVSDSADYRYAARMTISVASDLDPDGLIMDALCREADLSVRPKEARKTQPDPTHWTCNDCRAVNDVEVEDCLACDDGVRPET